MNDEQVTSKSHFPKKMVIWTILVVAVGAVLKWQTFYLNEEYNLDPAMISLWTLLLGVLLITTWGCWALFFARFRLLGLMIFLIPVGFFTLFYPNLSGDVGFNGFKPRFWTKSTSFVELENSTPEPIDLSTTTALDFPQFLGPNRNAQIANVSLADSWPTDPELLWKIDIGEGWSGFVVVNGYAITQEQRGAEECVTCYDVATGKLIWINRANRRHEDAMAMGKVGPRATPTIHEGMVYVTSGTGVLDCLDGSTGETVWSANVPELVGIRQQYSKNSLGLEYSMESSTMMWGRSTSPLIVDDIVVVPAGGPAPPVAGTEPEPSPDLTTTLIAFDKMTGEEKWRGGKRMVAYGSPTLATIGGKRQILLVAEKSAVGHDADTGQELWSHERLGGSNADANCSQVTVVDDNRLILSKGYNMGGELVNVSKDSENWTVTSIQKDPRVLKTKMTNPVIFEGHTYSLSDGFLECVDIETFQRKWKRRGRFKNGQVLLVGDKLLVHSEDGKLHLVKADPSGYEELGSIKTIDGICWNTICLYGDLVLVRSEVQAACYRLPTVSQ